MRIVVGSDHDGYTLKRPALARNLVRGFVAARYTAEERHAQRLAKFAVLEQRYSKTPA